MSNDNKQIKKSGVTCIKNKPHDQWRYENERANGDYNAKQFFSGNSSSLSNKEIKSNYWIDASDYE